MDCISRVSEDTIHQLRQRMNPLNVSYYETFECQYF